MNRSVIKQTKSLSPLTYEETDATIYDEDGKVYMEKCDEEGTPYRALVDRDCQFYGQMTADKVARQVDFNAIHLYVSSQCNLTCPLCYEGIGNPREPTLAEIDALLSKYKNKIVVLMGREPTCRKDIFDIIKVVNKQNRSCLLTNGVNLARLDFVQKLKDAGLHSITFSFNGFDDEIYKTMNGRPLLDIKLKALENIKQVGIKTILSATLAKGLNENQIRKLADFCVQNQSFIYEFRIRSSSPVGRHIDVEPFCMTEMLDTVSRELGVPKADILKEQAFWKEFIGQLGILVPETVKTFARNRLCSFSFHVRPDQRGGYACLGASLDVDAIKANPLNKPLLAYQLVRAYGIRYIAQNVAFLLKLPIKIASSHSLMVVLRCWPNLYNVDMDEIRKCPSQYYKNGEFAPFCYSNMMDDKTYREAMEKDEAGK